MRPELATPEEVAGKQRALGAGWRDKEIARLASVNRDLVSRAQLLDAGIDDSAIKRRLAADRLQAVFRGVLGLGAAPLDALRLDLAAVMACGNDSLLTDESALALWEIPGFERPPEPVVAVIGSNRGHIDGIRPRRIDDLDPRDIRCRAGIPSVSPARALLDCSHRLNNDELERGYDELRIAKVARASDVIATCDRCPTRRGATRLRALAKAESGTLILKSQAEKRLRRLIRAGEIRKPEYNAWVHGWSVDVWWPEARYAIEFDGFDVHDRRRKRENDHAKTNALHDLGIRVDRVTWRMLTQAAERLLVHITKALVTRTVLSRG